MRCLFCNSTQVVFWKGTVLCKRQRPTNIYLISIQNGEYIKNIHFLEDIKREIEKITYLHKEGKSERKKVKNVNFLKLEFEKIIKIIKKKKEGLLTTMCYY